MVSACRPDCVTDGAWALLGADGAIRLSLLRIGSNPDAADVIPPAEDLDYGRVGRGGVRIYKEASLGRGIRTQRRIPREMAFRRNPALRADGWLQRIEGGYVRARLVDALAPSPFKGRPSLDCRWRSSCASSASSGPSARSRIDCTVMTAGRSWE